MICSSVYRDRLIRPSPSGPDSTSSWLIFRGACQRSPLIARVPVSKLYGPVVSWPIPQAMAQHAIGTVKGALTADGTALTHEPARLLAHRGRRARPRAVGATIPPLLATGARRLHGLAFTLPRNDRAYSH